MGCYCNGKYHYTNMISALATGQISYKDAMCEILKRLCELENGDYSQVQADWTQTDTNDPSYIRNKPSAQDIQADWDNQDSMSPHYIQNKPTIPAAQIQSDWTQNDVSARDYIKNKPTIPSAQVQSDWSQTNQTAPDYIKNKPPVRTGGLMVPSLIPPSQNNGNSFLNSTGTFTYIPSNSIMFNYGIEPAQNVAFNLLVQESQAYPTFGWSRGTNLFGMSTDPRNDINDWSIIQHWPYVVGFEKVDNHYWKFHITAYIADYTCTIPYETMQFYTFGFRADLVFANSGLTWDVFKAAYNAHRTYSSVKYFSPGKGTTINVADVGLNATYTNAGGYLGMSDATGSGSVANTLTMGRYFNNSGNESMGFGLWPLQNFQQGSWFEAELWVWL